MTKKKTTGKVVATKPETKEKKKSTEKNEVENNPSSEEVKNDKSVNAENKPQEQSESNSDTNGREQGDNRSDDSPESEELSQADIDKENKKQFNDVQKLKAVAYNRYPDTSFTKLPKNIAYKNLTDLSKLPADIDFKNSEILMDNGQVYTLTGGLTSKFNHESLNNLK